MANHDSNLYINWKDMKKQECKNPKVIGIIFIPNDKRKWTKKLKIAMKEAGLI